MRGLMHLCLNWGSPECHSEVSKVMYPKEIRHAEDIHTWPVGKELEKYDQICKTCEKRFFNIEERKCLVCKKEELEAQPPIKLKYTSGAEYYYKCPQCGTIFYSYDKLD